MKLKQFEGDGCEIEEGVLTCAGCETFFPVIKGIPRMLPPELLLKLVSNYEAFLRRHGLRHPSAASFTMHGTEEGIAKGFEFEWQKHSRILPEHEKEFRHVLEDVLSPGEFEGRVVLDAGCGQGRFSYFAHKYGAAAIVAFDLGEQSLIAKKNLGNIENIHVVQASIYNPPFKAVFDIICSIGVIHHLPEPEKGFRKLFGLAKEGGKCFIWVYGYSSIIPVIKFLSLVRTKAPPFPGLTC